jgi:hypothetical protein
VRGAHPRLDGPERMLHGLAAHAHLVRVAVEPGAVAEVVGI